MRTLLFYLADDFARFVRAVLAISLEALEVMAAVLGPIPQRHEVLDGPRCIAGRSLSKIAPAEHRRVCRISNGRGDAGADQRRRTGSAVGGDRPLRIRHYRAAYRRRPRPNPIPTRRLVP
jgi:hypothetical protein